MVLGCSWVCYFCGNCFNIIFSEKISLEKSVKEREEKMAEVKIDKELHNKIKKIIKKGENRFEFPTVKSFVDKAVLNVLKALEKK